jgi:hypothetical protein
VDAKGQDALEAAEPREFAELAAEIHPRGQQVFFVTRRSHPSLSATRSSCVLEHDGFIVLGILTRQYSAPSARTGDQARRSSGGDEVGRRRVGTASGS